MTTQCGHAVRDIWTIDIFRKENGHQGKRLGKTVRGDIRTGVQRMSKSLAGKVEKQILGRCRK